MTAAILSDSKSPVRDALAPAAELQRKWRLGQSPNIDDFLSKHPPGSAAELAAVARVDLRQRWRRGERPTAREYLDRFAPLAADPSLAVDVIYAEFLVREELGLLPLAAHYQSLFPEYAAELGNQIELHYALAAGPLLAADTEQIVKGPGTTLSSVAGRAPRLPDVGPTYEIEVELGRGGMGVVYRARHVRLNRLVALKVVRSAETAGAELLARFRCEAEAVARLHHPHIVQIYDYGERAGLPFLALELVEGSTLAARLDGRPWPERQAAELVATLARAVQFAHENGVVHRDLKPANVLLSEIDRSLSAGKDIPSHSTDQHTPIPKITDFGLAKVFTEGASRHTQTGTVLGTPAYMAPEQAAGQAQWIGPATDIYALGAILYELLAGRPPILAKSPLETLQQVIAQEPVSLCRLRPQLSRDLATICAKCLAKEPRRRYSSAGELSGDLQRFLADQPIQARPVSTSERSWRWCRRNPVLGSLAAAVIGLLFAVAAVSTAFSIRLNAQLARTQLAEDTERQSRIAAQARLFDSYLAELRTRLTSRQLGQRVTTLETVREAQRLLGEIGETPERVLGLRNAAIAAFALPDLRRLQAVRGYPAAGDHLALAAAADRYAVSTSSGDVFVYRLHDGRELVRLPHRGFEVVVAISPEGKYAGISDSSGSKVWRIDEEAPRVVFEEQGATCLTFSPDPGQAAISRADGRMHLLDLESGKSMRVLGQGPARTQFAFHPASRRVVVCGPNELQVISLDAGSVEARMPAPAAPTRHLSSLAWHPSGDYVAAAGYDGGIALWRVASSEYVQTYAQEGAGVHLYFVTDGEQLIGIDAWSGTLRYWQTDTAEELIRAPIFSHCASGVTQAGERVFLAREGPALALWKVEEKTACRVLSQGLHRSLGAVISVAVSPEGRILALGSRDGLSLLDLTENRQVQLKLSRSCFARFAADGSLVARCDSGVYRWPRDISNQKLGANTQSSVANWRYGPPERICGPTADVKFAMTPKADKVVVNGPAGWQVVRPGSAPTEMPLNVTPDPRMVAMSASGKWVALGRWHRTGVTVVDAVTGSSVAEIPVGSYADVQFSPDERWLVTSPDGGQLWRTEDWQPGPKLQARGATPGGLALVFSPDSRVLALSQPTGEIRLVDPATGNDWAVLSHPSGSIGACLAFSPDQSMLVVQRWNDQMAPSLWDLVLLRRELRQLGLDWPADVLQVTSTHSIDPVSLTLAIDDGNLHRKQEAAALLRQATATPEQELSSLFQRAIELDPESAMAHNNLAWQLVTCAEEVRDIPKALQHARRAVELEKERHTYLNTLGVVLYRAGKFEEAIATLEQSLVLGRGKDAEYDLIFLALSCAQQGDWIAARDYHLRASDAVQSHRASGVMHAPEEIDRFFAEARAAGL